MCNKINPNLVERALGSFDKRGDGQIQRFPVLVALCECGETYWARVPNGIVWVEAEKDENRDVDQATANELASDIARTGPQAA